jgi:hypothetical protein
LSAIRPLASGWISSEFWLALAAIAGKVVVFLITMQVIHTTDPNGLAQQVIDLVTAIGTLVTIAYGAGNYVNRRTQLKTEAMKADAQMMNPVKIIDTRGP